MSAPKRIAAVCTCDLGDVHTCELHDESGEVLERTSLFGEPAPRPKRLADVTLRTESGQRVTWRLSASRRSWSAVCPFGQCGKTIHVNTNALRPALVACYGCGGWLPTP